MTKILTSGNPAKLIFNFSIPILIGNLIQQLYHMIDSMFIGKFVGLNAFAGVSVSSFLMFLIFNFTFGISNGCSIVLAQRFGAKSDTGVKLSIANAIYIFALISVIMTILGIAVAPLVLRLLDTPQVVFEFAHTYTIINFSGIVAIMGYNMFSQILRAIGDNKAALAFLIFSSILNIVLDWLGVAVLKAGVAGAAFATIISQAISAVCCVFYLFKRYSFTRPQKIHWKLNKKFFLKQLQLGLPIAFEFSVCGIGLLILQKAVNKLGPDIMSGFAIAMKIEDLIIVTFFAIAASASVFTAQNFGAQKIKRIKQGTKASLIIGFLSCLFFCVVFMFFWDNFVQLFINQSDLLIKNNISQVKFAAKRYIDVIILHYPILCVLIIVRNIVQSLGKTLIPLCGSLAETVVRTLTLAFSSVFLSYDSICYATVFAWYVACIMVVCSYIRNIRKLSKINIQPSMSRINP